MFAYVFRFLVFVLLLLPIPTNLSVCLNMSHQRYDEAADAYEEGLKTSPGDEALGRGLEDVLKAQAATKAPAGECCMTMQPGRYLVADRSVATVLHTKEYRFV